MVNPDAQQAVQASLDQATQDPVSGIHGIAFCAVNRNGDVLAQHASGKRSLAADAEPVTLETTFYIASCTKFIVAIACMQLVEQGKIGLDDANALYEICPELKEKKVYAPTDEDQSRVVPREGDITLKTLLAHTAGFGYTFFDRRVNDYGKAKYGDKFEFNEFSGDIKDIVDQPLLNQPGQVWEYGINIDWAGIVVERITGQTLDSYCRKNILEPLGLYNIGWFPSKSMRSNIMTMLQREDDGKQVDRDHLYQNALKAETPEAQAKIFNSGGAGSFGRPTEYAQMLAALLNDGVSPKNGHRILKKETVNLMWGNQIENQPDFARGAPAPANPKLANALPEFYPQTGDPPQGWGLSMFLTLAPGDTGRGANTGWWAGISNQFWWCDREKGVAGMICGQVLPFGDMNVIGQWINCEKAVYDALKKMAAQSK